MKQRKLYVWSGRTHNYLCKLVARAHNKEEAIELISKEMFPGENGWGILGSGFNPICVCYIGGHIEE